MNGPASSVDVRAEMAAYDALPARVRRALADAPLPVVVLGSGLERRKPAVALTMVRAFLARHAPRECVRAWGAEHPQAGGAA